MLFPAPIHQLTLQSVTHPAAQALGDILPGSGAWGGVWNGARGWGFLAASPVAEQLLRSKEPDRVSVDWVSTLSFLVVPAIALDK